MQVGRTILIAAALVAALAWPAAATAGVSCHTINAKGSGHESNFQTTADITGGGLLHGTTEASFTPTGLSGTTLSFTGTITFFVNGGTLTATLTGTFDVTTGAFEATTTSISGTGKLAGATGTLTPKGVEDLATGDFTETITGEICVDLSP